MDQIVRSDEEVNAVLNKAAQGQDNGSAYPGQSYEEGVADMHRWLTGASEDEPLGGVELADES